MKKGTMDLILVATGIVLLIAGLFSAKTYSNPEGIMKALPYVCVGVGCGMFGHGMGNMISRRALKNDPDRQKQIEIDKNDERNIAIANRAKAKAFDMMTFVFGVLMLSFALMGIDMAAVLLFVFAYLFIEGYGIYYHTKYSKEM